MTEAPSSEGSPGEETGTREQPLWPPSAPQPSWPPPPSPGPAPGPLPGPSLPPSQGPLPGPAPGLPPGLSTAPIAIEPSGLGPNTRCYAHPDRLAGAVCRSCNQPICADCMVEAPVGWHCQACVRRNARTSPVVRYRPNRPGAPTLAQLPVTSGIIAVCVVLFIASSADPGLLNQVVDWGYGVQIYGQWYRLFTSIFFHLNVLHIALNMFSLLIVGRVVEPLLGRWRYLALFLASGFGGSVASYLLSNPSTGGVGASGAIFGLFGAYFVLARRAAVNTSGILTLIAVNLGYSFVVPGISWQAHVGGLVTGLVVAAGFGFWQHRPRLSRVAADLAIVSGSFVVLGLLVVLLPAGVANLGSA
jgi:membrane associated rhomboid family serine protease